MIQSRFGQRQRWLGQQRWLFAFLLISAPIVFSLFPRTVCAEATIDVQPSDDGGLTVYKLAVTPADEPDPPLRHRLTVRDIELVQGNAATHYLRAFPETNWGLKWQLLREEYGEDPQLWGHPSSVPLHQLPLDKARQAAASFDGVINQFVVPSTYCRDCDWGLGIEGMRGVEVFQLLLPEFNASRSIARVLCLRARVALADGDYDRALDHLRMTYRLAENVGREPLIVCGLIGLAEASMANQLVVELIAAKGSPNLYWALAELPRPMVAMRKAMSFEMSLGMRVFPFLIDAETANHAPDEWARLFADAISEIGDYTASPSMMKDGPFELKQAAVAGWSVLSYPTAKQRLIEGGLAEDRVESMPVGQVIALDAAREYRRLADEVEKWLYVPFHIVHQLDPKSPFDAQGMAAAQRGAGYMLASFLLPAVNAASRAEVRVDRQLRALQTVEAIRMHAANTGKLPMSLDEIRAVPVPVNPATNNPFHYRLDGQTALLELPYSDGISGEAYRFEITLIQGD